MSVSLCMIVKNEEATLARCLESVRHVVDEMVIVDTGSTDRTVDIAKRYNARIFEYPWDGSFSSARNYALQQATTDWILLMDADSEFEKQDTDTLREMTSDSATATAYYCKVLSYLGDTPDPANVILSLNICLIKNRTGYRFAGDIYEQINCGDTAKSFTAISDLRVYHYGYLNCAIRSQGKRERNISMIQNELAKRPDDPFMLYSLGNEYLALSRVREAFGCYQKSYANFTPDRSYSPRLLLRLAVCCEFLGKTAQQLEFIDEALAQYPKYTDMEFIRGGIWLKKERYFAAIRSFKRCLDMGEPPISMGYLAGVGTYKAAYMLCQIYRNLGDPKSAMRYGRMALKLQPLSREICGQMAALLMDTLPPDAAAQKLARMLPPSPDKYLLVSDVFYSLCRWEAALVFARKAEAKGCDRYAARYDQGACLFFLKRYSEAGEYFRTLSGSAFESRAAFLCRLGALFCGGAQEDMPRGGEEYFCVLECFEALSSGKSCAPLAVDEASSVPYIAPIMSLLDILLKAGRFDDFGRARRLLNLISDDSALVRLGKLFFRNGYLKSAYRELERSIRLTGKTDGEALRMMKYILDSDAPG